MYDTDLPGLMDLLIYTYLFFIGIIMSLVYLIGKTAFTYSYRVTLTKILKRYGLLVFLLTVYLWPLSRIWFGATGTLADKPEKPHKSFE